MVGEMNKPEWMLANAQLKDVANCELDAQHPHLACDRTPDGLIDCQHCPVGYYCGFIANAGAKAVLDYLITNMPAYDKPIKLFLEQMLKELEEYHG